MGNDISRKKSLEKAIRRRRTREQEYISFKETQEQEYISFEETQKKEYDGFERILQDPHATAVPLKLDFLKYITSDFSKERELGSGGFGVVYKGILSNGNKIAVKKLKILETNLGDEQYQKELKSLIGLEHKNIVRFKGYCADTSLVRWPSESLSQGRDQCVMAELRERLLCFEYVPNKSLREHISGASCGLEWLVRFKIIKGICSGLHYLHTEGDIAHMDLKPENILLDHNMMPKISDFGTSRFFDADQSRLITTNFVGSWGYMAPEYIKKGIISKKADIFSFGVIIIELLTGSKSDYPDSKDDYTQFTKDVVQDWSNRLRNARYSRQVRRCISIALNSVDASKERRPTAEDIIRRLNEVEEPDSSWPWSEKTPKVATVVAIGVGALVRILSNRSHWWSWVVMILNVATTAVSLFIVIGGTALGLISYLTNHGSARSRVIVYTIGVGAVVLILLNPSRSWSWVLTAHDVAMTAVSLFTIIGGAALGLRSYLRNHCSSRPRVILFTVGVILAAAVLILLNSSSNLFTMASWAVTMGKFVIIAGAVTLLLVRIVVFLDHNREEDGKNIFESLADDILEQIMKSFVRGIKEEWSKSTNQNLNGA